MRALSTLRAVQVSASVRRDIARCLSYSLRECVFQTAPPVLEPVENKLHTALRLSPGLNRRFMLVPLQN